MRLVAARHTWEGGREGGDMVGREAECLDERVWLCDEYFTVLVMTELGQLSKGTGLVVMRFQEVR